MSSARIKHIVTQQIANAVEAITVYEAKIRMAHDSMDQVMAFSVSSISPDSSEESVGTSTARVILFGMIPTTIPPTTPTTDLPVIHDDTLLTPTISPTIPPPDGVLKTLTVRKSIGSLLALQLASRYPSDSSSSDSTSRYSSSGYAILDSLDDSSTATSARLFHKRYRSPTPFVPAVSPVREAPYLIRADLSPPPKRIRDCDSMTNIEVGLGVDFEDSYKPYTEPNIDLDIQTDNDECIAYADAIRARGMNDRDVVEIMAEEEVGSRERDTVEVEVDPRVGPVFQDDMHESVREDVLDHVIADGAVEVIESEQRLQWYRIAGVDLEVTTMTKRISTLERDNTRLRGMLDVESQRVDQLQRCHTL
ncbi:hypothetical protein Tco_0976681 [Tanacetum coccineum]|uniref:Uncharacterized protein n=1 Tax=Tanacetum coccineum TaxID=301880 RepID=A0ABQ5EHX4_9ASTR